MAFPSRQKLWVGVVAALTLVGFLDAAFVHLIGRFGGREIGPADAVFATVPQWFTLGLYSGIAFVLAARAPLHEAPARRALTIHLPAAIAFALVHTTTAVVISDVILLDAAARVGFRSVLANGLMHYFTFDIVLYGAITGSLFALDYYRRYQERSVAAAELEARFANARLDALRARLDPHFLFNALNVISGSALTSGPERVASLIEELSRLLRRSVEQPEPTTSLAEELDFLRAYVAIEEARLGERLRVTLDVDPALESVEIPSLLLQPLVENAIRHGAARRAEPTEVRVRVCDEDGCLLIEVSDTGPGFPHLTNAGGSLGDGFGLRATGERLHQLYGDRAELRLANRPGGGALVTVRLPANGAGR